MAASKKIEERVIVDHIWNGGQYWERGRIVEVNGVKLNYIVHVESYKVQSYGKVSRWNGEEWKQVHRISGHELKTVANYVNPNVKISDFDADIAELRRVAESVIL